MLCPICQETLQMMDRQGVEIDYCPKCRGVWLDRGELQKLIDFSFAQVEAKTDRSQPKVNDDPIPLESPLPRYDAPDYEESRNGRRYEDRRYEERRYDDRKYDDRRYDDRRYDTHASYGKPKKRESWLSELFDWD